MNDDNTRNRILKVACKEFERNGYKRADINAIANEAGVTKGAVYYYFKSKQELADSVIECELATKVNQRFLDYLKPGQTNSIQEMLTDIARNMTPEEIACGMIVVRFAHEIQDCQEGTRSLIRSIIDKIVAGLLLQIERDYQSGHLTKPIDSGRLAHTLCALMLGCMTLSTTYRDRNLFNNVFEQMNSLIDAVYEDKTDKQINS